MGLSQQKFRELVFQILYSRDMGCDNNDEISSLMRSQVTASHDDIESACNKVGLIMLRKHDLDTIIQKTSKTYSLDRIQRAECNILRLGVFEILYDKDIPPKVAISEGIRLCRKFSTPESATFINAILDAVRSEYENTP